MPTGVDLLALVDVGLAVPDVDAVARFLCEHLGMHELDRSRDRAVLGAGDGAATLSLARAEGPREAGALRRLVLRVADVERAAAALPAGTPVEGDLIERAGFTGPAGIGFGFTLVAGGGIDYDIDHVDLRVRDLELTRVALAEAGFVPRAQALHVADKYIALAPGGAGGAERPLLDHIALRVASLEAVVAGASARGLEIGEPAAGEALAVVLPGPERLRLRFVSR